MVRAATAPAVQTMGFSQAMDCVRQGLSITRMAWDDENICVRLLNGVVQIHLEGEDKGWLISEIDVYARDWQTCSHG